MPFDTMPAVPQPLPDRLMALKILHGCYVIRTIGRRGLPGSIRILTAVQSACAGRLMAIASLRPSSAMQLLALCAVRINIRATSREIYGGFFGDGSIVTVALRLSISHGISRNTLLARR